MRALLLVLLLLATPAFADGWQRYENIAFGYAVDIPPGLLWRGESYGGDGQDFTSPTVTLSLQARPAPAGLEAAIRKWRDWETQMGWVFTFEMTTPGAATASAKRPNWLLEMRALPLCGDTIALLQLEYGVNDAVKMQPVIARLASSFTATRKC